MATAFKTLRFCCWYSGDSVVVVVFFLNIYIPFSAPSYSLGKFLLKSYYASWKNRTLFFFNSWRGKNFTCENGFLILSHLSAAITKFRLWQKNSLKKVHFIDYPLRSHILLYLLLWPNTYQWFILSNIMAQCFPKAYIYIIK